MSKIFYTILLVPLILIIALCGLFCKDDAPEKERADW